MSVAWGAGRGAARTVMGGRARPLWVWIVFEFFAMVVFEVGKAIGNEIAWLITGERRG